MAWRCREQNCSDYRLSLGSTCFGAGSEQGHPATESVALSPVQDGIMQSLTSIGSTRMQIHGHACPRCKGLMALVDIKPARAGFEQRIFEGISCEHADMIVVENKSQYSGL